MPSHELLLAFFVTTAVFAYIPGPAMLYATAQTIARGRAAGLMASLGIHLGCYAHVIAAAAGLSFVFHAVPALYLAIKLAGAAYLVWLGIQMLRRVPETAGALPPADAGKRAFMESVLVEVLNPKTAIFFIAFLPQFVDPAAAFPVWLQFLILGSVVNLMFSSADIVCVFFASAIAGKLRQSDRAQTIMRRAGGAILIGLGLRLAADRS